MRFVLTEYIDGAMQRAIVAMGNNIKTCEQELRAALEDWLVLGLKMKHRLPVIEF